MLWKSVTRLYRPHIALMLCAALLCPAFAEQPKKQQAFKQPLRIAVVAGHGVFEPTPISRFIEIDRSLDGFEATLLEKFAKRNFGEFKFVEYPDKSSALRAIALGKADIGAAHFCLTNKAPDGVTWSIPLVSTPVTVVHNRRKSIAPTSILDLLWVGDKIVVTNDGRYSELMRRMQWSFPELNWHQIGDNTAKALEYVASGKALFTLADTHELQLHQLRFPELKPSFQTGENRHIVWAVNASDAKLQQAVNRFIAYQHFSGAMAEHYQRNFAHLEQLNPGIVSGFRTLITKRLPRYQSWLQQAGQEQDYDWRLLAAVSYQESHWSPSAKSPTGVRGFMMLTRNTAYQLGVTDRTDAKQSIFGGAKFLRELSNRLGTAVTEPERTWLALAAYNVGLGHLRDARQLAYEAGGNPNSWLDVKRQLPLLAEKPFCESLRYGCARGHEAVLYVTNIRGYYDLLRWHSPVAKTATDIQSTEPDAVDSSAPAIAAPSNFR